MDNRTSITNSQLSLIREVIATWEGRVYGWHGTTDPDGGHGYGLFGFRYDWFHQLKRHYCEISNTDPNSLDVPALTSLANDPVMRQAQEDIADKYLLGIFDFSIRPRKISQLVTKLLVADIDINNGLGNSILYQAGIKSGLGGKAPLSSHINEITWAYAVVQERDSQIGHLFAKYPGLKVRYHWYKDLLDHYSHNDIQPGDIIDIQARNWRVIYQP